jgi:hypothetical protein
MHTTGYQKQVNSLVGAMGPSGNANWNGTTTTTGPVYSLGAQPLYYSTASGEYKTSVDSPADTGSVSFSHGKRKRKSHKSDKRKTRRRKSSKRKSRKSSKRKTRRRKSCKSH